VRDHDGRLAVLVDRGAQQLEHARAGGGVEVAGRLVGEEHGRPADQGAGDRDALLREAVDSYGQTTVMVTHDPHAAAIADRVLFLADGRVVADIEDPTEDTILDALKAAS
jgi:predicted ABC-type transport system involved in lysophospholipase L1 biosynthesis ATPase subunit